MGMTVHDQISTVAINNFRESRGSKIGKDLWGFTLDCGGDG